MTTDTTEAPKTKLIAALVKAQGHVRPVAKDSRNEQHKYNYASSEAVIDEARAALSAYGLCVMSPSASVAWAPTSEGIDVLYSRFELHHESGEHVILMRETPVIVHTGKTAAQAVFSAQTAALAYMLRDLLLLSRLDDEAHAPAQPQQGRPRQEPPDGSAALVTAYTTGIARAASEETISALSAAIKADLDAKKLWRSQAGALVKLRDDRRLALESERAAADAAAAQAKDDAKGSPGKPR